MKKWLIGIFFLSTAFCEEKPLFYGNPPESCPPPFRFFVLGNYLYWQASEDNLEYAMQQQAVAANSVSGDVLAIHYPYKDGLRLGGGMVFAHYDWQLEIGWTRFYHDLLDTRAGQLIALWMHPESSYRTWASSTFNWDFRLDTLDFDVLRVGYTNGNFTLTPRLGLKRGWIQQLFHVRYDQAADFYDIRFHNDFRCIGPRIVFDTQLFARWGLNIAASAGAALLYGEFDLHRMDVSSIYSSVDYRENIDRFKPMVQGGVAVEWDQCFASGSCRLIVGIGYEGQVWWGQNQLRSFVSESEPPANIQTNGALTLKGLDLHARFDF
jgi:hypothetical protein